MHTVFVVPQIVILAIPIVVILIIFIAPHVFLLLRLVSALISFKLFVVIFIF